MQTDNRPLSPHLQIYRLPINAIASISHRISGLLLAGGTLVLVYWILAAAAGPQAYADAGAVLGSIPVQILMFLWSFTLFYHVANGVRHLVWDAGYGFDLETAQQSAYAVCGVAAVLAVLAWVIALAN